MYRNRLGWSNNDILENNCFFLYNTQLLFLNFIELFWDYSFIFMVNTVTGLLFLIISIILLISYIIYQISLYLFIYLILFCFLCYFFIAPFDLILALLNHHFSSDDQFTFYFLRFNVYILEKYLKYVFCIEYPLSYWISTKKYYLPLLHVIGFALFHPFIGTRSLILLDSELIKLNNIHSHHNYNHNHNIDNYIQKNNNKEKELENFDIEQEKQNQEKQEEQNGDEYEYKMSFSVTILIIIETILCSVAGILISYIEQPDLMFAKKLLFRISIISLTLELFLLILHAQRNFESEYGDNFGINWDFNWSWNAKIGVIEDSSPSSKSPELFDIRQIENKVDD